jgi:DNA-binding HxlR family transcriptional regulator
VLDRIGDKWTLLVCIELAHRVRRFRELQRAVPGISQRMLTLTVRRLERDGMVKRTVIPSMPVRVEYELTALGRSLSVPISALSNWAAEHRDAIEAARKQWDAAEGGGRGRCPLYVAPRACAITEGTEAVSLSVVRSTK